MSKKKSKKKSKKETIIATLEEELVRYRIIAINMIGEINDLRQEVIGLREALKLAVINNVSSNKQDNCIPPGSQPKPQTKSNIPPKPSGIPPYARYDGPVKLTQG